MSELDSIFEFSVNKIDLKLDLRTNQLQLDNVLYELGHPSVNLPKLVPFESGTIRCFE